MRCAQTAAAEPLAGTAPRARWWWLIEVAGSWGAKVVAECRIPAVRALPSGDARRVILIRRPGRHPASDDAAPLRVWIAGAMPGDPPTRLAVTDTPEEILTWPIEGPATAVADPDAPVLAVCTNASRDLCCGLDGRALVTAIVDEPGVWECSHLGGHRFAPTALHVPTGLVYGRLTDAVARDLLRHGPDADSLPFLRGRSALSPAVQAAEIDLLSRGLSVDTRTATVDGGDDEAVVGFAGSPAVRVRRVIGVDRPEQCGGESVPTRSWQIVGVDD